VTRAAFGLGSNLGDRRAHLERAIAGLRGRMEVVAVSAFRETLPVGGPPQGPYLNAVAVVETGLGPRELLEAARALEAAAGRVRGERFGPRTLDVDLLLYGDRSIELDDLVVPHPRLKERRFVLEPLAEVAPGWTVPGAGATVEELLADLPVHP
jgi:2-amino-4-hydroxy-6-hydroxymethyldihydropteridine diphosphokinase